VIGAVIDLGHCLDLVSRENLELVRDAYRAFKRDQKLSDLPMPVNRRLKSRPDRDRVLRFLDCAVIGHLHDTIERDSGRVRDIAPFYTVRGMFTEGKQLYPGCGYLEKSHVQIAVRNPECIKGIFFPRNSN
jgi:hypothetical protein